MSSSKSSARRTTTLSSLCEDATFSHSSLWNSSESSRSTSHNTYWNPKYLLGSTLLTPTGESVSTSSVLSGEGIKAIGFLFAAQYCSSSKRFVNQLSTWYTQDLKNKGLEIVFISLDENEEMFQSFFDQMPWLALSYKEVERAMFLFREFTNWRIPAFPIFDPKGCLLSLNGRFAIAKDPKGECSPWKSATSGTVPHHSFQSFSSRTIGTNWSMSSNEGKNGSSRRGLQASFRTKGTFSRPREHQRGASKRARPRRHDNKQISAEK